MASTARAGVTLSLLGGDKLPEFMRVRVTHRLEVSPLPRSETNVEPGSTVVKKSAVTPGKGAGAPRGVKQDSSRDGTPTINTRTVLKQERLVDDVEEPERIVTGIVLVPEEEDTQGQIYSKEEVQKACYWWMENSGQFAEGHSCMDGAMLDPGDIAILECWVQRGDTEIGGEPVKDGTWLITTRVNKDAVWEKIVKGEINAWSIGAWATSVEEVVVDDA